MHLKIQNIYKGMPEKEINKIDAFILDPETNGEFINTIKYLSYHGERFLEDSIYVTDKENGSVMGVVLATVDQKHKSVVSYGGTTFAGPVLNLKMSFQHCEAVMELLLDYYERRYQQIKFKITPEFYSNRQIGVISYILLKHGYRYGMTALANVIDLFGITEEETVFRLYDSKRRNQIRKSIRNELFTISRGDAIKSDIWLAMNESLGRKFGVRATHSYEEISELQKKFPKSIIPYEVYSKEGEYAAFALIFKFKNVFHTQYLDVNYAYSKEYPNLFLIHFLIQDAANERYRLFSFGASTEQDGQFLNEGLFTYKQGYGGGSIILPAFDKNRSDGVGDIS